MDDPTMRERIHASIESYPGIHLRGLVSHLDTSVALVRYHLEQLQKEGTIRRQDVGGFARYFPVGDAPELKPADRKMLGVLRRPRGMELALLLLEHGMLTHGEILEMVGGSKATLSYQLKKLVQADIIEHPKASGRGFSIKDEARVRRLLAQSAPMPDSDRAVQDLWSKAFSGGR